MFSKMHQGIKISFSVSNTKYLIDVKTGDVKWAGTDANVYIFLYGEADTKVTRK